MVEFEGGELKIPAKADSESLQAKFVKDLNELSLRSDDINASIEKAREFQASEKSSWHPDCLPISKAHTKNLLRLVCVVRKKTS